MALFQLLPYFNTTVNPSVLSLRDKILFVLGVSKELNHQSTSDAL